LEDNWGDVQFVFSGGAPVLGGDTGAWAASFIEAHPNTLLSPEKTHRADLVADLEAKALFEAGFKFYSSAVPSAQVRAQFFATDTRLAYYQTDGQTPNEAARDGLALWGRAGFTARRALRLHVTVPRAQVARERSRDPLLARVYDAGTHVLDDGSIAVNVDASNLHLVLGLPNEETEEKDKAALSALYRLLRVVTGEGFNV